MDFGFNEEQEKLRKEVYDFYLNELPSDFSPYVDAVNEELQAFYLQLQKKAGAKRYLTPGWPKEYGGMGLGSISQGVIHEVEGCFGFTWPNQIGLLLAGPGTIVFGTDEQKKWAISPITRGEVVWFEAFTEPEAGSDEANQQTRAIPDGDDYFINGQKTFITGIYRPDWLFTEVRTADTVPKHRGISIFLIPANLPGITFRPLPTMGFGTQNEIFFDDVRVNKKYLLGELNKGFYHAMQVFEYERSNTGPAARDKRQLVEFAQFCKEEKRNGKPLIEDPEIRKKLALLAVESEVWRLISWRTAWRFAERERLGPLDYDLTGFYNKIYRSEHPQVMMEILGTYGQLRQGSKWAKLAGAIEKAWQKARSLHSAGTIEIYKIVLAQRGLGLPRPLRTESGKSGENK
jgi:alkylation response protein AidB-like acyl-CoA dehydrogenase